MMEKSKFISEPLLTGNISLRCGEELYADFSMNAAFSLPKTDVIKVYLLSERKGIAPINAGTARRGGDAFYLSGAVELPDGCRPDDIDGAEVVQKNVFTERRTTLARVSFDDGQIKTPLQNGAEALEGVKEMLSRGHGGDAFLIKTDFLKREAEKLERVDFPVKGFRWYRVNDIYENFSLSAIRHILSSAHTQNCLLKSGFFLIGINGGGNFAAVAVAYSGMMPPLERADDCRRCILNNGTHYAAVGILLEPDGQYFAKISDEM